MIIVVEGPSAAGKTTWCQIVGCRRVTLSSARGWRSVATRRRRSFDQHSQLAEPLREWYQAIEALEPGRVVWELPSTGVPQSMPMPRERRSDVALLDRLVTLLPS